MGIIGVSPHAQNHQEIVGSDPLVNYGIFERIRRPQPLRLASSVSSSVFFSSGSLNNTMQNGHNWVNASTGAGTATLNYTGDSFFQSPSAGTPQCIKVVSGGDASGVGKVKLQRQTAINLTTVMQRVWIKIDPTNASNLHQILIYAGGGASAFTNFSIALPVKDPGSNSTYQDMIRPGEWFGLTLTPASYSGTNWAGATNTGTLDWTTVQDFQIAVNDNGGSLPVTIYLGGWEFLPVDTTYSTGVVSFTFDDLYSSQYSNGLSYLAKYGYHATMYAIQDNIGTAGYMTQAQVDQSVQMGHEISPHAYNFATHNLTNGLVGASDATLLNDWGKLKGWMHQNGYHSVEHFCYPQGKFDATLITRIKQQYSTACTTNDLTVETLPAGDRYRLRRIPLGFTPGLNSQRTYGTHTSVGTINWLIDQVHANGGWLIFLVHDIVASPSGADNKQVSTANWQATVDYVNTIGVPVRTVGDVLGL